MGGNNGVRCVREVVRQDRRRWRDVLAEYRANAGRHVAVTLPKVSIQQQPLDGDGEREHERVAA